MQTLAAPADLLSFAEAERVALSTQLEKAGGRDANGQFFTPLAAAELIASMPRLGRGPLRLLDPGAGSGMLAAATTARCIAEGIGLHILAVEKDPSLVPTLRRTMDACQSVAAEAGVSVEFDIVEGDFIDMWSEDPRRAGEFDLVVLNPPYAKLAASSPQRQSLRKQGIDAPNLYAAFLALSATCLRRGGQLVAITPRSFCNGPYFGKFRAQFLDAVALDRVHVFESRSTVFRDTAVLQENVVFAGTRDGERASVSLSLSRGHEDPLQLRQVPYAEVVHPDDPHQFIRLASSESDTEVAEQIMRLPAMLADLGVTASTGRVVDFRSRPSLRFASSGDAYPLLYPANLKDGAVSWPREGRKAQWFVPAGPKETAMLLPEGWYCLIKRFSAKEERRRVVAAVWDPVTSSGPIAVENHVNVLHADGGGLEPSLARGLTVWLNSTLVDRFFRTFSGHTQVNATDLRTLRNPSARVLRQLGDRVHTTASLTQEEIDGLVEWAVAQEVAA